MPTHDYIIANQSGAAFRTDLNNALAAIVSNNSNSSSPATTYAYQWWADTSAGVLKIRNSANNAWIELLQLDGTITLENGSVSSPALAFRDDLNTGIFSNANDQLQIVCGGATRAEFTSQGITIPTGTVVAAGGTFTDDVLFDGATAGRDITFDRSENALIFADEATLRFGGGNDLIISHDPSPERGVIQNASGNLELITNTGTIRLESINGSELMANFTPNGGVVLYTDNVDFFQTTDFGAKVVSHGSSHGFKVFHSNGNEVAFMGHKGSGDEGNIILREGGTAKIILDCEHQRLSLGSSNAMKISHNDSTTGTIEMADGHSLIIRGADNTSGTPVIQLNPRGNHVGMEVKAHQGVALRFDNSLMFETTSVGVTSHGTTITHSTIRPANDDNHSIGLSNRRYTTIFATNGSINTSDKNEKNTIVESDLGLDFINLLKPVSYKWNKDDGKTHYGLIAQDLEETILSLGKTVTDFGGILKEKDSPMGLSYPQLFAPLIKAVQQLSAKVAALEAA